MENLNRYIALNVLVLVNLAVYLKEPYTVVVGLLLLGGFIFITQRKVKDSKELQEDMQKMRSELDKIKTQIRLKGLK